MARVKNRSGRSNTQRRVNRTKRSSRRGKSHKRVNRTRRIKKYDQFQQTGGLPILPGLGYLIAGIIPVSVLLGALLKFFGVDKLVRFLRESSEETMRQAISWGRRFPRLARLLVIRVANAPSRRRLGEGYQANPMIGALEEEVEEVEEVEVAESPATAKKIDAGELQTLQEQERRRTRWLGELEKWPDDITDRPWMLGEERAKHLQVLKEAESAEEAEGRLATLAAENARKGGEGQGVEEEEEGEGDE